MKIIGYKFGTGFYYVDATLILHVPLLARRFAYRISFLVNKFKFKRLQTTTISVKDSIPFSIIIPQPKDFTPTDFGEVETSVMYNCVLAFGNIESAVGQSAHLEFLPRINILNPQRIQYNIMQIPSVLGNDILCRYKDYLDNNVLTLEK